MVTATKKRPMTFREFLKTFLKVDNRVGDLARDLDRDWHATGKHFTTKKKVLDYLKSQNACDDALGSARDAWARYGRYLRKYHGR